METNMITDRENIPVTVAHIAKNLFDSNNTLYIRENYKRTLISIRDYCNEMINVFDRQVEKDSMMKVKKKRA